MTRQNGSAHTTVDASQWPSPMGSPGLEFTVLLVFVCTSPSSPSFFRSPFTFPDTYRNHRNRWPRKDSNMDTMTALSCFFLILETTSPRDSCIPESFRDEGEVMFVKSILTPFPARTYCPQLWMPTFWWPRFPILFSVGIIPNGIRIWHLKSHTNEHKS